jgi:hypothetical protein
MIPPQLYEMPQSSQRLLPELLAAAHEHYSFLVAPIYMQEKTGGLCGDRDRCAANLDL